MKHILSKSRHSTVSILCLWYCFGMMGDGFSFASSLVASSSRFLLWWVIDSHLFHLQ